MATTYNFPTPESKYYLITTFRFAGPALPATLRKQLARHAGQGMADVLEKGRHEIEDCLADKAFNMLGTDGVSEKKNRKLHRFFSSVEKGSSVPMSVGAASIKTIPAKTTPKTALYEAEVKIHIDAPVRPSGKDVTKILREVILAGKLFAPGIFNVSEPGALRDAFDEALSYRAFCHVELTGCSVHKTPGGKRRHRSDKE